MKKIFPEKLKSNNTVRVITPARSLAMPWINEELKKVAQKRFEELGLNLTFAEHVNDIDDFNSSSIKARVSDLHEAFQDKSVKLVITVIGGFNSNQLLRYLDYDLIKSNPKILCGYSDITALANAIYAKTGLITYSGPHYFSFGDKKGFDYTLDFFKKCLFSQEPFELKPAEMWSDDRWANDQEKRHFVKNEGYWVINEGKARGAIVGGNQCTFNLLHGTEFMPKIEDSILFLEDDDEEHVATIDRDLQSIIHQPGFEKVRGVVIGRFQPKTGMTKELLTKIIKSKIELNNIPVIANVDFGHTMPIITFPIGGVVEIEVSANNSLIRIVEH
jgi:muramoyltetrapeptide carboxypeptidase LdcA involved in peptidoglycan recycling